MYTVVRFCADESCSDETLMEFGARLDSIVPNSYEGRLDRIGRRFSKGVSTKDDWAANLDEALQFIRKITSIAEGVRASGISVEIDMAVEPEDLRGRLPLSCGVTPDILAELARAEIALAITIYGEAVTRTG